MSGAPVRWVLAAALAAGAAAAATQAPRLLRGMELFRVQRVEVVGTRHLAPHAALAATGITRASSVFDDPAAWRGALLRHPLVADARIERRLPGGVVVSIRETEPVALALTPELRPVDGRGRLLPIDLAAGSLDLPVLLVASGVGADGRLADPAALALLAGYDRLRRLDPGLATRVSEIHPASGGLRLSLRRPAGGEALVPADAGPLQLRQLELALADLSARGELERLRRVDARFRDQIVVSLNRQES
ncbi:MAG TPA: FtsQ-type POTRA domain-containing protein [Longimicrobiales bacterium]|nr:FtsQ-type POTRA domain-containing protein [Longimicrobiales bacterium]